MNPRLIPSSRVARITILRSQSDERLAELVRHGSDAAFEAIVNRYRRPLVGHCARILGSNADAEEAVQDALVSAHGALVGGNEVRSLGPWLHTVAHNAALQILRRRVARAECPQEECSGQASVDPPHAVRDELRDVVRAVKALPARQRDAIVMRELEGRSYAEIAARLGASDGAVRQLLNRARTSMRESLGALIPAEPLVRWLVSADEGSPARGLLTLSGSSAIAIKLSGAALVSAVSVVTLLPSTHIPAPSHGSPRAPVTTQHAATTSRASRRPIVVLVPSRAGARSAVTGGAGRAPVEARGAFISTRSKNQGAASTKRGAQRASGASGSPGEPRTGQQPGSGSHRAPTPGQQAPSPGGGGSPGNMFERPMIPSSQPQLSPGPSPKGGPGSGTGNPAGPGAGTPSGSGAGAPAGL